MGIVDKLKSAFGVGKRPPPVSEMRPTELDWFTRGIADIARLPTIPYVGMRFCYDMYHYSDLLKTIVRALVGETFRNGLTIVRKFVCKCTVCGTEYQTQVERCQVCGSDSLRPPDIGEYNKIKEWLEDVNLNDQSLVEVLKEIDEDLNIVDNAFLCVLKEYYFDENGRLVGAKPLEVLRAPPDKTQFIMDKLGRFARTDDGQIVMFCLQHRTKYHLVKPEKAEDARCPECGKQMFPAYYRVWRGTVGKEAVYYTNGEMLHIKKFTQGIGYGMPPVYAVWMKLMILLKQDYFILTAYHLQRPPKGILVLRGNRESIEKAWRRMMDEARTNPHMIYPLVVEPSRETRQVMEWLDLTLRSEDINFIEFREELRRTVGALWGVMPIFTGEAGGYGLANEGLQVVVTNRAVEMEQTLFNEKVLPWLCRALGFRDWEIQLIPSEARDVVARLQREQLRIQNAQAMQGLGYKPVAYIGEDGLDFYYVEPETGEEIPKKQEIEYRLPRMRRSARWMPRFEGEPFHGRPRQGEQRFEGEETGVRRPKVEGTAELVGRVGDIFEMGLLEECAPDNFAELGLPFEEKEIDVLKAVWSKAVKRHFYGGERFQAASKGDYWEQYAGLTKRRSAIVNGILLMNILRKNYNKASIVDEIVKRVGISKEQAETIVETELANIMNLAREIAYKERTKVKKFVYVTSKDACEVCKAIAEKTKKGVTLEELKKIIREVAGEKARGYLAHPRCKCTFTRAHGEKAWWE
jgi:uncharacterized OB-fold protein